jgi:hypothetical protein
MFNFFKKKTKPKESKEKKLGYPTGPVLGQKGFVNEKVCDADIQKYKLQEIRPIEQWKLDEGYFYYRWVIDREREIWFTYQKSEKSGLTGDPRDPDYYTGNGIYVLHYKGENIEVVLKREYDEEREKNALSHKNPYYIIWDLIRINKPESLKEVPDEEIIAVLKEVLSVFMKEYIHKYIPKENIIVQFKF